MSLPRTGQEDRALRLRRRSAAYELKVELRRLERAGRGFSTYAKTLRRLLRAFSEDSPGAFFKMLAAELRRIEQDDRTNESYRKALQRAVSIIQPEERSVRKLFTYYLQRMEAEGRGSEPFADALRRCLDCPQPPTLEQLFFLQDQSGSSSKGTA